MATELNHVIVDARHDVPRVFGGAGEMVRRMRAHDWGNTALGPVALWPDSLCAAVSLALGAAFPMLVLSGQDLLAIVNDAAVAIFGDDQPWALGEPAAPAWPADWPALGPMLASVRASGLALRHDHLALARGAGQRCFSVSISPICGRDGASGAVIALLETAAPAAREASLLNQIAAVRSDLDSVMAGTSDAFLSVDTELRVVAVKKSDPPMEALPVEQMLGRALLEVAPGLAPVAEALRSAMRDQRTVGLQFLHPPSKRWFSVRCYAGGQGAIAFANEITHQKSAEERLKQAHAELESRVLERTRDLDSANALLEAVFDRSPAGIVMADFNGRIVRANAAFERLVGLDGQQLRGQTIERLADPSDAALNQMLLDQLRAGDTDSFLIEMRYRRPDGSMTWVENFVGTINGDDGRPRYIVKIVQDISARKAAADEVLASRNELRFLYDWLQHVRKDERLALAREVHDQLGQILSAAKIDIKLLLDDIAASGAGLPRRKLVAELSSASDTLDHAIDSARSIAVQLRPPEIDSQGLYSAIDWHARDFERRTRVQVVLDLPGPTGGPTCAGAAALFRILQEALTNVLRHARATCVAISVKRRGGRILLRVRDNGVGIAARVRPAGTLGLVGMRERADLAHGRVGIRRLASGGTLLSALLPVSNFHEN